MHSITLLKDTSTRIINEVRGINRVIYDITSKPPGTIDGVNKKVNKINNLIRNKNIF